MIDVQARRPAVSDSRHHVIHPIRLPRLGTESVAFTILALVIGVFVAEGLFNRLNIYTSIIAVGLALALQKYVASYFGFFVIRFSRVIHIGDRIECFQALSE